MSALPEQEVAGHIEGLRRPHVAPLGTTELEYLKPKTYIAAY